MHPATPPSRKPQTPGNPATTASSPAASPDIEAQEDALDRLLNDVDAPFDPDRVWQILAELAGTTTALAGAK